MAIRDKKQGCNLPGPSLYLLSFYQACVHDSRHGYRNSGISSFQLTSKKRRILPSL